MALNIKDRETEELAAELAVRLHTTKTAAIRHALREQLSALSSREEGRLRDVIHVLRTEIWPLTTPATPITKREREEILGYSSDGV